MNFQVQSSLVPYGKCNNPFHPFFEKLLQAAIKNHLHVQVKVIITETYNMSHTDMSHII